MRILFLADNFFPEVNSPATHVFERCRIWVELGHDVTVVTCAPNFPEGQVYRGYRNRFRFVEMIEGIRVVRVWTYLASNQGRYRRALDYASYVPMALWACLIESKPDVVISTSPQLFVPLAGIFYCAIRRVPHVFELRDLWPQSMLATESIRPGLAYRLLERLEMWLYRKSHRILSFTKSFRDDLKQRGVAAEKIDVVYGGGSPDLFNIDLEELRTSQVLDDPAVRDCFTIGYIGTLGLAHGLENVLSAAELLKDEPIRILLVGEGAARRSLLQKAKEKSLSNVIFVDRQPKIELPRYWALCDAALVHLNNSPIFSTVVPSKLFETMTVGMPVIYAGPPGEATEIIGRHRIGITAEPMDPFALAAAMRILANNSELRNELAGRAAEAAPAYTRKRQAEQTLEVLQKAIG